MWSQNPKGGGGAAWQESIKGPGGARRVVRWRKGLDEKEMLAINKELPFPYVLHFRQPSHDTSDSLLATHPFQVDEHATTGFDGTFDGWVLFHNGYWAEWRKKLEALMLAAGGTIKGPSGAWSDTRGLALVAHHLGFAFLEMVNEKVLCLGPGDGDIEMFGGPWLAVGVPDTDGQFVVSNRTWERTTYVYDRRNETSKLLTAAQDAVTPKTGKSGGTSQQTPFPSAHGTAQDPARSRGAESQQVQEGTEGHLAGDVERSKERGSLSDGSTRSCGGCHKMTSAGTLVGERWLCWQCWARDDKRGRSDEHSELYVGTCSRCKVGSSGMKTVLGDEWLCHACWETGGKPKIYYARERMDGKTA